MGIAPDPPSRSIYTGYWCFEVAAFVRAPAIDDTLFAHNPFYPSDLVVGRSARPTSAPSLAQMAAELPARPLIVDAPAVIPSADAIERLDERDALKLLAHLLLPSDPSLEVEIDLAFRDSQTFRDQFARRFEERGVEPSDPIDVWVLGLCDGLAERGRVGIIDWRASIEDIIAAVEGDARPLPITLPAGPGWRPSRMPTSKLHAGSSLSPTTWQKKVGPWPIWIPIPISTL